MCPPAAVSIGMTVVSTLLSAYGAIQQGKASSAQAQYQAQVARNNEIIANRAADDALKRGNVAEVQYRQKVSQLQGRQRAVLASSGSVIDQGSALDITSDTAGVGELDALTIQSNAEREAYNRRVQGMQFGAEAGIYDARAKSASSAAALTAGTTLLAGAGSVAEKWYTFDRLGWNRPSGANPLGIDYGGAG